MGRAKCVSVLTLYNVKTGKIAEHTVPFNMNVPVYVLKEFVRDHLKKDLEVWRLDFIR